VGRDADLNLLTSDLQVETTYSLGRHIQAATD